MFTSKAATHRSSRKIFEKLVQKVKKDPSFKLSKNVTSLFIDTKVLISHFSVVDMWHMSIDSQLDKTIEQSIDPTLSDPIDTALHSHAAPTTKHGPMHTLSFSKIHAMSGNIWHSGSTYELAVKGAPEHILAMCDLTENEREAAERKLHQLASSGGRVVAFAHTSLSHTIDNLSDLTKKHALTFDGFVSLSQHFSLPVRALIAAAQKADITVHLMTGDHFESALHIAKELSIATRKSQVFDSRKMHVMTNEEFEEIVKDSRVFCRVTPHNKARIIAQFNKAETLYIA